MSQEALDEVARKLNGRPRETLGFATPAEKLAELIDGLETSTRALTRFGLRPSLDSARTDETMRDVRGGALTS